VYFESHYDRYKPQVQQRWRESDAPGSGIWFDLGSHLLDQALQLFGLPETLQADLAVLRPGGKAVDYFNVVLTYPRRRVVLHSTVYAVAETARFIVQGEKGSYVKFGLDPQEDRLKAGERLPQADWGYDMRDGVMTLSHDGVLAEKSQLTIPGNYPAYYAGVRDAINGQGDNPVPAADAIRVMEMIELGMQSSEQQATLKVIKN
jgi:predicted dehydrogenase